MNAHDLATAAIYFRFAIRSHTGVAYALVGEACLNAAYDAERCVYEALSCQEQGNAPLRDAWCRQGIAYLADALDWYRRCAWVSLASEETTLNDWPYHPVYAAVDNNSDSSLGASPQPAQSENQPTASNTQ